MVRVPQRLWAQKPWKILCLSLPASPSAQHRRSAQIPSQYRQYMRLLITKINLRHLKSHSESSKHIWLADEKCKPITSNYLYHMYPHVLLSTPKMHCSKCQSQYLISSLQEHQAVWGIHKMRLWSKLREPKRRALSRANVCSSMVLTRVREGVWDKIRFTLKTIGRFCLDSDLYGKIWKGLKNPTTVF